MSDDEPVSYDLGPVAEPPGGFRNLIPRAPYYYVMRVDPFLRADPETGPEGPMSRDDALTRRTEPDPGSRWRTVALRVVDGGTPCESIRTEYGTRLSTGGYMTWNTEPYIERVAPLAERIEAELANGKVFRRRIILVEDWAEVDRP